MRATQIAKEPGTGKNGQKFMLGVKWTKLFQENPKWKKHPVTTFANS